MENPTLAELKFLLDYGFLKDECVVKTPQGVYRFVLTTITPLEEVEADQVVSARLANMNALENDSARNIQNAIELLARCIQSVNGVALHDLPGLKGETDIQKRRYAVSKFSEPLMLELWQAYSKLRNKTASEAEGDSEELKKS